MVIKDSSGRRDALTGLGTRYATESVDVVTGIGEPGRQVDRQPPPERWLSYTPEEPREWDPLQRAIVVFCMEGVLPDRDYADACASHGLVVCDMRDIPTEGDVSLRLRTFRYVASFAREQCAVILPFRLWLVDYCRAMSLFFQIVGLSEFTTMEEQGDIDQLLLSSSDMAVEDQAWVAERCRARRLAYTEAPYYEVSPSQDRDSILRHIIDRGLRIITTLEIDDGPSSN